MFFDGSQFSEHLKVNEKVPQLKKKKLEYEGNAVILRCVDIKQFGGAKRLFLDLKGKVQAREPGYVPITMHDPFRLMEGGTYRIMTHLVLSDLPSGVICRIAPTPEVARTGLLFAEEYIKEGELWVTAYTLRRIELELYFPFAMLLFIPDQILEEEEVQEDDKDSKNDS